MIKKTHFLLVFGVLCALFFTNYASAAGYNCPAYQKYTSCSAGYYMTASASSTACAPTAGIGNACRLCSVFGSNYTCAGGTACPALSSVTCNPGTYWNGSSCGNCTSGNYCPGFTMSSPSSGYGLNACTGATYSSNNASSCTACPSGYTADTSSGKTSASSCKYQTTGGYYIKTANDTAQTICTAGYYCPSALISYGSAGNIIQVTGTNYAPAGSPAQLACPSGYAADTSSGKTLVSQCKFQTTNGYYIKTSNDASQTICTGGYYCPSSLISYGSTGTIIQVSGANYAPPGSSGQTPCPSGYTADTNSGKTSASQCSINVPGGQYIATGGATSGTSCNAGTYSYSTTVNYGYTNSCYSCSGATYSATSGATYCTSCPTGYTANTSSGKTSAYQCTFQTTNGYYIKTGGDTSQTICTAGYICPSSTITYGAASTISQCTGASYSASGASSCMACPAGYTEDTTSGKSSPNQCAYKTTNGYYIKTAKDTFQTICPAGYICPSTTLTYGYASQASQCTGATYAPAGSSVCSACPVLRDATNGYHVENNGVNVTFADAGAGDKTACYIFRDTGSDWWEFEKESKGYWKSDGKCYYSATNRYNNCEQTKFFATCFAGYFINNSVSAGAGFSNSCTACSAGTYTVLSSTMTLIGISTTYQYSTSCTLCPVNTYSPTVAATLASTCLACPAGNFSPKGSDEAGDCGRKLNVGANSLYLRSVKKTTPSLNVSVGGKTYYGNMGTETKGQLRLNSGGTKYSVYDDSM